jgi:MFS transporter, CP family, cyanate transporter
MTSAAPASPAPPHPHRWAMLAGVWVIYGSFGLLSSSMAPLVKLIIADLNLSQAAMGSILGAWPLVYVVTAVPLGALLDRIGLRRGLLLCAVVMGLSGLLRAVSYDYAMLFFAVAVFGFGAPLVSIGAPKLIAQWFGGKERGFAMGIYMSGPSVGGMLSLSLTNAVLMPLFDNDWHLVMLTYAVVVFAAGGLWWTIASHQEVREREQREAAAPKTPQLGVFLDLLKIRAVQILLVTGLGSFFFSHGLNNWLPAILQDHGMSAARAGFWASVPVLVGICAALTIPRLALPSRRLWILALLYIAAGFSAFLLHSSAEPLLLSGLFLQGATRQTMMTIAMLILMETRGVDPRHMGAAGGLFFSAAEIGGVLGPLSIGWLADVTGGFDAALSFLVGVAAFLFLLLIPLRREMRRGSAAA